MSSRSLRRGVVAALFIASAPVLAACSAGGDAASLQVKPNTVATEVSSTLKLNNVVVITDAAGDTSGPANLAVAIANTGSSAETLQSVTVNGVSAKLTKAGKDVPSVSIPAGGSVSLSAPGQVMAQVPHLSGVTALGGYIPVTLQFATAGQVKVNAASTPGTGYYAQWAPSAPAPASPVPTAPVSGSPAPPPAGAGNNGTTGSPTPTATPSPTAS